MLENIRKVGKAIREKFHWVPHPQKCYLVMDNAGGHGKEEAITKYTDILETEFDIEIIHQIPRSPETNVLDLGIWCSLQWAMDKLMRGKRGDMEALVQGVACVWEDGAAGELSTAFSNVFKRLGRVLHLITEDNGGNELVEKKRGKRWAALDDQPFAVVSPPVDAADVAATAAITTTPDNDAEEINDLLDDDDDDEVFL